MYYVMRASAPSLHRESTDSLMQSHNMNEQCPQITCTMPSHVEHLPCK